MNALAGPRWRVSFADLALLLLCFFVLLHASDEKDVAAGARSAFSSAPAAGPLLEAPADDLFEKGEARLTRSARERIARAGNLAAGSKRPLLVESEGRDLGALRYDGWDLAAARAAALARALRESGLGDDRIAVVMPRAPAAAAPAGQRLTVRFGP